MSGNDGARGSNRVTRFLTRMAEVPMWVLVLFMISGALSLVDIVADHGWLGVAFAVGALTAGVLIARHGDRSRHA